MYVNKGSINDLYNKNIVVPNHCSRIPPSHFLYVAAYMNFYYYTLFMIAGNCKH